MGTNVNAAARRRQLMLEERNRCAALRLAYPQLAHLRIELVFTDLSNHPPSPQQHTLYPAAPAYFRFTCPCSECDAEFDLMPAVSRLLDGANRKDRAATASGQLSCVGVRLRESAASRPCPMQLKFKLVAAPATERK